MQAEPASIRGLIFDMDGTLVDNMAAHTEAWGVWHGRQGLPFDADSFFTRTAGRTNGEIVGALLPHLSGEQMLDVGEMKEAIYREIYKPRLQALPGLETLLDAWQATGRPMTVATAAPVENAALVLDGLDLRRRFAGVFSPSMGYRGKPHPDLFLAAAQAMGLAPGECLVFEDAPLGIEAARRAGMCAVAVTTMLDRAALDADNVVLAMDTYADPALWRLLSLAPVTLPSAGVPA